MIMSAIGSYLSGNCGFRGGEREREKRSEERDEAHTNGTMPEMAEKGFGLI